MKNDLYYIKHIRDAIRTIQEYTDGMDGEAFAADSKTQDATIRQLEIIGEAAGNISGDFKAEHDEVPWRDIMALRNKLIHEYFGVSIENVWKIVEKDIPELETYVQKLLADTGE